MDHGNTPWRCTKNLGHRLPFKHQWKACKAPLNWSNWTKADDSQIMQWPMYKFHKAFWAFADPRGSKGALVLEAAIGLCLLDFAAVVSDGPIFPSHASVII